MRTVHYCLICLGLSRLPLVGVAEEARAGAWSWRGELGRIEYCEPGVMEEEGLLFGISGARHQGFAENWIWRLEGSLLYGRLDYKGAVVNLVTGEEVPAEVETPNMVIGARILAGRNVESAGRPYTAYAGFGYRLLIDDLPGDAGYTREQTYLYVPIGFESFFWNPKRWLVGMRVEFDWLLRGINESSTNIGFLDAHVTQDSGYGLQLALSITRELSAACDDAVAPILVIEPFIEYWDIDRSDSDTDTVMVMLGDETISGEVSYFEPANTTEFVGIRAAISF